MLVGNKIVNHSVKSRLNAWLQRLGQRQLQDEMRNIYVLGFDAPYVRGLTVDKTFTYSSNSASKKVHPNLLRRRQSCRFGTISLSDWLNFHTSAQWVFRNVCVCILRNHGNVYGVEDCSNPSTLAHYLWWSTLEPLIWPQIWVQIGS